MKVKVDLSNYAKNTNLKTAAACCTSKFAKVDLAHLESNVDKLDIDEIKNVLTDLSNL